MKNLLITFSLFLIAATGFSQNVGYDEANPASKIAVKGNFSVGSSYSTTAAPTDGAIIQGNTGIGTSAPTQLLHLMNGNLQIDNNNNTAGKLIFTEPSTSGTNYVAFKAGTMATNVTYTLPTADGTSGQQLTTDGAGTLSWAAAGSASAVGTSYALTPVMNDPNTALGGTYAEVGEVTVTVGSGDVLLTNAFFSAQSSTTYQVMKVTRSQTAGSGTPGTVVGYCAWSQHDGSRYSSMSLINKESGLTAGTWYYKLWTTAYTASTQNYDMVITKVQ